MDSNQCIRFVDVSKVYVLEDKKVTVFEDLNLDIDPEQITVLIGKSGFGKTTLLRLLAGLEKPTAGMVHIPETLRMGMMFQESRLMPWLNCLKNVTLGIKNPDWQEAKAILKLVGLEGFEKAYPHQLSGGMQQRAALARTLIRKSNLILMDEPFSALDAFTRKSMQEELLRIQRETHCGILFVTHDLDEALKLGDRILVVKDKSAHEGDHNELLKEGQFENE